MDYRQQVLAVMNRVEMIVALYDGMIRFLHGAIDRVEARDTSGRRQSVGRALEILTYLQARLRPEVGGRPAESLSEFYAAMYAQCVRASRDASIPLLQQTIRDIRNVRDAWQEVSASEAANAQPRHPHDSQPVNRQAASSPAKTVSLLPDPAEATSRRWTA